MSEKRNNIVRKKQEKCVRKKEKVVRKGTIALKRSGKCVREKWCEKKRSLGKKQQTEKGEACKNREVC